ncbi:hypothetical protein HPB50_022154 [Hyalomma asiaticum]|uniref:Uncharacterized protein n=1 Tax=Hyalomma asiaticum TaxID=266040 RepID=A0ACB7S1V0_HYAAI|nr:hypothetical protein HPB50_022154 [Hyalomma asiaticum]
MAPSRYACVLCLCPFFGKQHFFRCEICEKRVHAKYVTWPDEQLQLLKSGSRSFSCNLCDSAQHGGKPNDDTEACATAACSLQPRCSPTSAPLAPSGDLGGEVAGLRRLLVDALEGISFLSDEVSQLREANERVRKEHSRVAEQQVRIVASLRGEVRFLRDELTRRVAPKLGERPAKSPTAVQCDFSVNSDTPVTSDTTHNT